MRKKTVFIILAVFALTFSFAQTRSLDFFINAGLQSSPLLKDYAQQVKSNSVDSSIISASRKPQVNALGTVMLAPTYNGYGYDEAVTNGGNYQAVASVSQSLFVKKTYAPQYEALRIENASATNSGKISSHELEKEITDQYLTAYSSFNQLTYNRSLLQLLDKEQAVLESYVNQGIYRQTDYLALELEKQMQEVQLTQLMIQYKADIGQLNVLCGIEDTSWYEVVAPPFAVSLKPANYFSPFQMQFRIDSLRINNSRSMIDMRYRPRFGWFADAGLLSSQPLTMYRNFGFSFGFLFTIPIYDGRQKGFEYQKLSINESIRTNYRDYFSLEQRIHLNQIQLQLNATEKLIAQEKNLLITSDALVTANRTLLDKGQASVSDFILAIKNNIDIKNQLNQAEITKLQLKNELNYWNW
jgi:hypothetical protein